MCHHAYETECSIRSSRKIRILKIHSLFSIFPPFLSFIASRFSLFVASCKKSCLFNMRWVTSMKDLRNVLELNDQTVPLTTMKWNKERKSCVNTVSKIHSLKRLRLGDVNYSSPRIYIRCIHFVLVFECKFVVYFWHVKLSIQNTYMHFYNKESLKEWIQIIRARHIFKKLKKDKMEILATSICFPYMQPLSILNMLTYNLIFLLELIFIMCTIYSVQTTLPNLHL